MGRRTSIKQMAAAFLLAFIGTLITMHLWASQVCDTESGSCDSYSMEIE